MRCACARWDDLAKVAGLTANRSHWSALVRPGVVLPASKRLAAGDDRAKSFPLALTWPIVLIVLFGALLHASWNVLVKSSTDKALDTALIHLVGSVIALPLLFIVGVPGAASGRSSLHRSSSTSATTSLTGAYKHGDMGLTYPLMRGVAMLVALSARSDDGRRVAGTVGLGGCHWHLCRRPGAGPESSCTGQSPCDIVPR